VSAFASLPGHLRKEDEEDVHKMTLMRTPVGRRVQLPASIESRIARSVSHDIVVRNISTVRANLLEYKYTEAAKLLDSVFHDIISADGHVDLEEDEHRLGAHVPEKWSDMSQLDIAEAFGWWNALLECFWGLHRGLSMGTSKTAEGIQSMLSVIMLMRHAVRRGLSGGQLSANNDDLLAVLFEYLHYSTLFPSVCGLLDDFLAIRRVSFDIGRVPKFWDLLERLSDAQLMLAARVIIVLMVDTEELNTDVKRAQPLTMQHWGTLTRRLVSLRRGALCCAYLWEHRKLVARLVNILSATRVELPRDSIAHATTSVQVPQTVVQLDRTMHNVAEELLAELLRTNQTSADLLELWLLLNGSRNILHPTEGAERLLSRIVLSSMYTDVFFLLATLLTCPRRRDFTVCDDSDETEA
jgi:hypothetical protein